MPLIFSEPDALARIYASSLFELAQQAGGQQAIEQIGGELDDIIELARADAGLSEFFSSRILSADNRQKSLKAIFGGRVHDLTLRFLLVLNQKGRLSHLAPIAGAFDQMVQAAFGRVEVDLYTASPAEAREVEAVKNRLRAVLGKEPVVHTYTDPSMIGGIRLQIGDQLIDASVSSNLRKIRERLTVDGAAAVRAKADRFLDLN